MNKIQPIRPYASGYLRTQAVTILLVIQILLSITAIWSTYLQIGLISRVMSGLAITEAEATANAARQQTIAGLQVLAWIVTGVLFLMWIHRAHSNLPALGAQNLRFSPGWAVGYWFIPIVNLFRPYQVVQEIWKASDPDVNIADPLSWKSASASSLVDRWWSSWLALFFGGIAMQIVIPAEFLTASWAIIIVNGLEIISGIFTISVVQGIDKRQKVKSMRFATLK